MSTFRLDGDLLTIGEGTIEVRTLVDWLAETGVLERYGWLEESDLDEQISDAHDDGKEAAAEEWQYRLDNAADELTYLDHDADPYRYHDDNQHTGAVKYCIDPFCQSAGRTETVIDILKGA